MNSITTLIDEWQCKSMNAVEMHDWLKKSFIQVHNEALEYVKNNIPYVLPDEVSDITNGKYKNSWNQCKLEHVELCNNLKINQ